MQRQKRECGPAIVEDNIFKIVTAIVWGISNDPKVSTQDLTARNCGFYLLNSIVMNKEQLRKNIKVCIGLAEDVEEFLQEDYSIEEMNEAAAKAGVVLIKPAGYMLDEADKKALAYLYEQHATMIKLLRRYEKERANAGM